MRFFFSFFFWRGDGDSVDRMFMLGLLICLFKYVIFLWVGRKVCKSFILVDIIPLFLYFTFDSGGSIISYEMEFVRF